MSISAAILITLIAIAFSALFSGAEIAFMQSSKVKIEIDATRKSVISRALQRFARHADMFISTLLLGNNIALVIYGIAISIIINPMLYRWLGHSEALVLVANTIISTLFILFAGEFLPKTIFRINPNFTMRLLALPLYIIYVVLYPLALLTAGISKGLMKTMGIKETPDEPGTITMEQLDDYIQHNIDEATDRPVDSEVKIFRNAIDFKDTQVSQCMIPRNEIVGVPLEGTTKQTLMQRFVQTGLSKIVVYDTDINDVKGYIHVAEMFTSGQEWQQRIKPVVFVPETMLADKLMQRLLGEKRSMAIAIDEFGGTAGLVTLEDMVEEIFGEIEDEHDHKRIVARQLPDGDYEISGRAEIERLNEEFHLNLRESDDYHTLAGYILDNLEALPEQGARFNIGDFDFTVTSMTATRIQLVKLHRRDSDENV